MRLASFDKTGTSMERTCSSVDIIYRGHRRYLSAISPSASLLFNPSLPLSVFLGCPCKGRKERLVVESLESNPSLPPETSTRKKEGSTGLGAWAHAQPEKEERNGGLPGVGGGFLNHANYPLNGLATCSGSPRES